MADISRAMQAKSDQLNATDIMGFEPVIRVRAVDYKENREQPVWVYFDGDNNRPWKPSKGMVRILGAGWGVETDNWVGKHVKLMFEPSVMYAGKEVGGIQIKGMSDIDAQGMVLVLTINRQKRKTYQVECVTVQAAQYPADRFAKALPVMAEKMKGGEMTLQQVIAKCQQTGMLSVEQLAQLEAVTPVEIEHGDDEEDLM